MEASSNPGSDDFAAFNSRWARATSDAGDDGREALSELAASYFYCVYAWWRRAGHDVEAAADATLACFARWLGDAPPRRTDSGGERMRTWLLERLVELSGEALEAPAAPPIAFDPRWAESRYADEPPGEADAIFQRRWAITVLEFTVSTMSAEYAARGEEAFFPELVPFAGFDSGEEDRYAAAAARTGRTIGAMHKEVFDFRHRQRELLLYFAGDTLLDPAEAQSEITALLCACDAPGPETATAKLPTAIGNLHPDEMLARAMQSVRMTGGGAGGWQPPTVVEAARLFPQYEVSALLGRGGMGAVYQGRQVELDRLVAIKLLPLEVSVDRDFADRFRREARAMAKLQHPNIIDVHDFGTTAEGHLYFVMEYVDGTNLDAMIRGPGLEPAQALQIVSGVCDALAYAHAEGVVHRDIKPANVMVSKKGRVKVADFGLARLADAEAEQLGHTVTGTVMGTPDYMAPEQKRGTNVDHRADIYSLGVMLYEMLCREVPQGIFDPPSHRVAVDSRVDQVVIKAMHQQPERRYQSTQEMKADVEAASAPQPKALALARLPLGGMSRAITMLPQGTAPRSGTTPPSRKKPLFMSLAVLAAAAAGLFYVQPWKKSAPVTPAPATVALPEKPAIDLLALADVQRDRLSAGGAAGSGGWTKRDGMLAFTPTDRRPGKIGAPIAMENLRDYEISVIQPRSQASAVVLDCPITPDSQATISIVPSLGIELRADETRQPRRFGTWPKNVAGPPWKIAVRIQRGADDATGMISASVNGLPAGEWHGNLTRLGKTPEPHPDFPGHLVPALFAVNGDCAYSSWTLNVFEGAAKVLRGLEPAASGPSTAAPRATTGPWRQLFAAEKWKPPVHLTNNSLFRMEQVTDRAIRARILWREGSARVGLMGRAGKDAGDYQLEVQTSSLVRLAYFPAGRRGENISVLGTHALPKPLQPGDAVLLELRVQGDRLIALVDGTAVIEARDSRLTAAGVWGIVALDGWYDSVEAQTPPPAPADG